MLIVPKKFEIGTERTEIFVKSALHIWKCQKMVCQPIDFHANTQCKYTGIWSCCFFLMTFQMNENLKRETKERTERPQINISRNNKKKNTMCKLRLTYDIGKMRYISAVHCQIMALLLSRRYCTLSFLVFCHTSRWCSKLYYYILQLDCRYLHALSLWNSNAR